MKRFRHLFAVMLALSLLFGQGGAATAFAEALQGSEVAATAQKTPPGEISSELKVIDSPGKIIIGENPGETIIGECENPYDDCDCAYCEEYEDEDKSGEGEDPVTPPGGNDEDNIEDEPVCECGEDCYDECTSLDVSEDNGCETPPETTPENGYDCECTYCDDCVLDEYGCLCGEALSGEGCEYEDYGYEDCVCLECVCEYYGLEYCVCEDCACEEYGGVMALAAFGGIVPFATPVRNPAQLIAALETDYADVTFGNDIPVNERTVIGYPYTKPLQNFTLTGDGHRLHGISFNLTEPGTEANFYYVELLGKEFSDFAINIAGNDITVNLSGSQIYKFAGSAITIQPGVTGTVINIVGSDIEDNDGHGIHAAGNDSEINVLNNSNILRNNDGILVDGSASGNDIVLNNRAYVEYNQRHGINIQSAGGNNTVYMSGYSYANNNAVHGINIAGGTGNDVTMTTNSIIRDNGSDGIYATGNGSEIKIDNSRIERNGGNGIHLTGTAAGNTVILVNDTRVDGNGGNGIMINSSGANNEISVGIVPGGLPAAVASHVQNNGGNGIFLLGTASDTAITLNNGRVSGNGGNGMHIHSSGANNVIKMENQSYVQNNGFGGGAVTGHGIYVTGGASNIIDITGSRIRSNRDDGLHLDGGSNNVSLTGAPGSAFTSDILGGTALEPHIGRHGIYIRGNVLSDTLAITDNVIIAYFREHGIYLDGSASDIEMRGLGTHGINDSWIRDNLGNGINAAGNPSSAASITLYNVNIETNAGQGISLQGNGNGTTVILDGQRIGTDNHGPYIRYNLNGIYVGGQNFIVNMKSASINDNGTFPASGHQNFAGVVVRGGGNSFNMTGGDIVSFGGVHSLTGNRYFQTNGVIIGGSGNTFEMTGGYIRGHLHNGVIMEGRAVRGPYARNTFTLDGTGRIGGNTAFYSNARGVLIQSPADFIMQGGEIKYNHNLRPGPDTTSNMPGAQWPNHGGGIAVDHPDAIIAITNNAVIENNTALNGGGIAFRDIRSLRGDNPSEITVAAGIGFTGNAAGSRVIRDDLAEEFDIATNVPKRLGSVSGVYHLFNNYDIFVQPGAVVTPPLVPIVAALDNPGDSPRVVSPIGNFFAWIGLEAHWTVTIPAGTFDPLAPVTVTVPPGYTYNVIRNTDGTVTINIAPPLPPELPPIVAVLPNPGETPVVVTPPGNTFSPDGSGGWTVTIPSGTFNPDIPPSVTVPPYHIVDIINNPDGSVTINIRPLPPIVAVMPNPGQRPTVVTPPGNTFSPDSGDGWTVTIPSGTFNPDIPPSVTVPPYHVTDIITNPDGSVTINIWPLFPIVAVMPNPGVRPVLVTPPSYLFQPDGEGGWIVFVMPGTFNAAIPPSVTVPPDHTYTVTETADGAVIIVISPPERPIDPDLPGIIATLPGPDETPIVITPPGNIFEPGPDGSWVTTIPEGTFDPDIPPIVNVPPGFEVEIVENPDGSVTIIITPPKEPPVTPPVGPPAPVLPPIIIDVPDPEGPPIVVTPPGNEFGPDGEGGWEVTIPPGTFDPTIPPSVTVPPGWGYVVIKNPDGSVTIIIRPPTLRERMILLEHGHHYLHEPFVVGYPDETIGADRYLTRAEMAQIFFNISTNPMKHNFYFFTFSDVPRDHWAHAPISYFAARGLLRGFYDGTFRPDVYVSNAEFAVFSKQARDVPPPTYFETVPELAGHWAERYISSRWFEALPEGYVFIADDPIQRYEAIALVNFFIGRVPDLSAIERHYQEAPIFPDIERVHWAFYEVMEAGIRHEFHWEEGQEYWILDGHEEEDEYIVDYYYEYYGVEIDEGGDDYGD